MLDKLIELGISSEDINNLKEYIDEDNTEDFLKIIHLLENIGCKQEILENIIVGNPNILERSYEDVYNLLSYLDSLGFTYLNLLLDSYPLLISKDAFEIKDYLNKRLQNGEELSDIIDDIDSNPSIIDIIE